MFLTRILWFKEQQNSKRLFKTSKKDKDLEKKYEKLSDSELKEAFNSLKASVQANEKGLDDVLDDSFAITREASKRVLGLRHFDVQLSEVWFCMRGQSPR